MCTLKGANTDMSQRKLSLAYCGKDELVFQDFKDGINNVHEGLGRQSENECWLTKE